MEPTDNKKLFLTMAALAGVQTFFVMVMGALVVFKSPEWTILGCLLLFSLVNLAATLSVGTIVTRIVESVGRQSVSLRRVEETLRKMLRGPRSDGLIDLGDSPVAGSPEAAHRDMVRRFGA
jgi:hypothetical protein